jgi:hypothetical protein
MFVNRKIELKSAKYLHSRSLSLSLGALFSLQFFYVVEFILHGKVADLQVSYFGHNLAHDPCKRLPLLFLAFLPVVLPKVLIWRENWQFSHFLRDCDCRSNYVQMIRNPKHILRCLDII